MKQDLEVRAAFLAAIDHALLDLGAAPSTEGASRTLSSLRSSSSMVGEAELAAALFRLERRTSVDPGALGRARELLVAARARYAKGEPALRSTWPRPPDDLDAGEVPTDVASILDGELSDRLLRIDRLLAGHEEPHETVLAILREVHGMKGAALAAKAEAMAWYCHGLEAALRGDLGETGDGSRALQRAAAARPVMSQLAHDPIAALARLRALEPPRSAPPSTGRIALRRTSPPRATGDDGARVPQRALDGLVTAAETARRVAASLDAGVLDPGTLAGSLGQIGTTLSEARRMLGPPRPWGPSAAAISRLIAATAAINELARAKERSDAVLREVSERLEAATTDTLHAALALRRVPLGSLFERARAAVEAQGRLAERDVSLLFTGADLEVDRPMLEQLTDPLLQLVGNAIAHGIEAEEDRIVRGKPRTGTIGVTAERVTGGLRLTVGDDGRGVRVDLLRQKAIEAGLLAEDLSHLTTDEALFNLLFLPGFTTRAHSDLLAGRGIGLDLAAAAIRRLGGTVRFASTEGRGATVTMDLPVDTGPLPVLWTRAGELTIAVSALDVRRVELPGLEGAPALDALLTGNDGPPRARGVELDGHHRSGGALRVSVDEVLGHARALVVPVPPILRMTGPYRGAALADDGTLGLLLDVEELAQLA